MCVLVLPEPITSTPASSYTSIHRSNQRKLNINLQIHKLLIYNTFVSLISVQNPELRFISHQLERILLAVETKTVRQSDLGVVFPIDLEADMAKLCGRIEEDKLFAKKLVSCIKNFLSYYSLWKHILFQICYLAKFKMTGKVYSHNGIAKICSDAFLFNYNWDGTNSKKALKRVTLFNEILFGKL